MPRLQRPSSLRSFGTLVLAAIVGAALPGLAAAQAWDWDEDFVPTPLSPAVQAACDVDADPMSVWVQPAGDAPAEPCVTDPNWS